VTDDLVRRLWGIANADPDYAGTIEEAIAKLSAQGPRLPEGLAVDRTGEGRITAMFKTPEGIHHTTVVEAAKNYPFYLFLSAFLPTPEGHDSSAPLEPVKAAEDTAGAKYAETFCSQCGKAFGPGNSGYSHCSDHIHDSGIEAAAKLIDAKVTSYTQEHGSYDGDTGFTEFSRAGEEYVSTLEELAEEIRALKTRSPAVSPDHRDDSGARVKQEHVDYRLPDGRWSFANAVPTKQTTTPKADGETLEQWLREWFVGPDRFVTGLDLFKLARKLDERAA